MRSIITILARKGSKGLLDKHILPFNGKPLCWWTMKFALMVAKGTDPVPCPDVVVATDDHRVAEIAHDFNLWTIQRNPEYAGDNAGKVEAIRDVLFVAENELWESSNAPHRRYYDLVIDLDVTNPCRRLEDIEKSIQIFKKKRPKTLFSVVKSKKTPYFNQIFLDLKNRPKLVNDIEILRRQDAPEVFDLNSNIYIYDAAWLRDPESKFVITDNSEIYIMPDWTYCDIDNALDFKVAEFLHKEHILN